MDVRWSVCISCLVPFVRQIWMAVGMESSKIHRTEHNHLFHLDTEHMVYLINTCLPHKLPLTNLSWLWFYLNNEFTKAETLTQLSLCGALSKMKHTHTHTHKSYYCLSRPTNEKRLQRAGANVKSSSTRNKTRRVSLPEPCQHITEAPGGNWSIWNKISPGLGGVWKQLSSQSSLSLFYIIKTSTVHTGEHKASHIAQLCIPIHSTIAES